jgi:hypothetical protein
MCRIDDNTISLVRLHFPDLAPAQAAAVIEQRSNHG